MLESVKVLAFTHYLQGPLVAQMMGDFGADVIKVEPLAGAFERRWSGLNSYKNGVSVYSFTANRSQRSLSVDLKTDEGRSIAVQLAKKADVLIENDRPGVMERLHLGYEELKKENPGLIYCSCSAFGNGGPYQNIPGQDLLVQAMSGIMMQGGRKADPPIAVGSAIVDMHAAVLAEMGILAALYEKRKTGLGKKVECSLLDAALDLQIEPMDIYLNGFSLYERSVSGISSRIGQAPYGVFKTSNGYLCLSMIPLKTLAEIFEDDGFLAWEPEGQFVRREEINERVAGWMRTNTSEYWMKRLDEFKAWYSVIFSYEDVEKNPQVQWNEYFNEIEHPTVGSIRLLSQPVRFNGKTYKGTCAPPCLGENTVDILASHGYEEQEIERLIAKGIIFDAAGSRHNSNRGEKL